MLSIYDQDIVSNNQDQTLSEDERAGLAKMILTLFAHWQLTTEQQLALLGHSTKNRSVLTNYRNGKPLSAGRDLMDRVAILLNIHKSLRLLFPQNRDLRYQWVSQPNRAFNHQTPIEVMVINGLIGLHMVQSYLDRARGN